MYIISKFTQTKIITFMTYLLTRNKRVTSLQIHKQYIHISKDKNYIH